MKYIPGYTIVIKKLKVTGSIKNYFNPGVIYEIYNVTFRDSKCQYMFTDGTNKFELSFDNTNEAEKMIDYLVT